MKLGDALHMIWQNSHSSSIHSVPLSYKIPSTGGTSIVLNLNDIRAIWEYLNQDVPLEGTIKDAFDGKRSRYISEERNIKHE